MKKTIIISILVLFPSLGCIKKDDVQSTADISNTAPSGKAKPPSGSKATTTKKPDDKASPVEGSDVPFAMDLSRAIKVAKGESLLFFTMKTPNKKTKYFLRVSPHGAREFGKEQALGKIGMSPALTIGDDLFLCDLTNSGLLEKAARSSNLMQMPSSSEGPDLTEVLTPGVTDTLIKVKDGLLGTMLYSHSPLAFYLVGSEVKNRLMDGGNSELATDGQTAYFIGFKGGINVANTLWRLKDAKGEAEEIAHDWGVNGIGFESIAYDKVGESFILIYRDYGAKSQPINKDTFYFAKIDKNGVVKNLGSGQVSSLDSGAVVGSTYFFAGKKPSLLARKSLIAVVNNNLKYLGISDSFEYFKASGFVYAQGLRSNLLYKLLENGNVELLQNDIKKNSKYRYFHSDGSVFLHADGLYLIETNGQARKIDLPEQVKSFEPLQLCDQSYLLMRDKSNFLGIAKLARDGKYEIIKEIPAGLKNIIKIPSEEEMFVIAGQESENGPWKNWLFQCQ
jgi:hypothetical protein